MNSSNDPIADFLTRIRNACRAGKAEIRIPHSKMKEALAQILQKEGYVEGFDITPSLDNPIFKDIAIKAKYVNKVPAITGLKRVSRPGLRRYVGVDEIPRVLGGLGVSILSTSRGLLTGREARREKVGGELLAYVW